MIHDANFTQSLSGFILQKHYGIFNDTFMSFFFSGNVIIVNIGLNHFVELSYSHHRIDGQYVNPV